MLLCLYNCPLCDFQMVGSLQLHILFKSHVFLNYQTKIILSFTCFSHCYTRSHVPKCCVCDHYQITAIDWTNIKKRSLSQNLTNYRLFEVCARLVSQLQLHYCNSSRVQTFVQSYAVLHTEFTGTGCSRYMSFIGIQRISYSVLFHCAINRFQKTKYKGTFRVLWICAAYHMNCKMLFSNR